MAARQAGIDRSEQVGLHSLRHSAASAMLQRGVPMSTVSRYLGHASISVTVDLYGHLQPEDTVEAGDVLGAAFGKLSVSLLAAASRGVVYRICRCE